MATDTETTFPETTFPATFSHRDGRERQVYNLSQQVAAEFDGFREGSAVAPEGDEFDALDHTELKDRVSALRDEQGVDYDGPALNASAEAFREYLRGA